MTNPSGELWALPLIGARKPFAMVRAPISVQTAQFSPDGRWIAYVSTESGQSEVYVVSFPGGAHKTRISTNGGTGARWKGREIFYRASGMLMAVEVSPTTGSVTVGTARPIIDLRTSASGFGRSYYDVTPDGQRFLVNMRAGEVGGSITLVVNSPTALGARAPSVREEPVQQ
jgi:hypothetical protein